MAAWVVYESMHGNTEKIAKAIGEAIGGKAKVLRAADADPSQMSGVNLLIVGSPTYGGRPTPAAQAFLGRVSAAGLKGVRVAAFDTRVTAKFARIFGHAADKILAALVSKGGARVGEPQGFFVKGSNGPLADGEIEKAAAWAKAL
jgi:flavodoxin I